MPERPKHRVNDRIRFREIRVIDPTGEMLGVMTPEEGRQKALALGLDLVEVSPKARPPVCRIMDYGKYKYEQSKAESAKKNAQSDLKTVQMRPKTDAHDLDTKLRRAKKFLERGNRVRLVMRMRGRERGYPQRWVTMLHEVYEESLCGLARVVSRPTQEGRAITMLLEPVYS